MGLGQSILSGFEAGTRIRSNVERTKLLQQQALAQQEQVRRQRETARSKSELEREKFDFERILKSSRFISDFPESEVMKELAKKDPEHAERILKEVSSSPLFAEVSKSAGLENLSYGKNKRGEIVVSRKFDNVTEMDVPVFDKLIDGYNFPENITKQAKENFRNLVGSSAEIKLSPEGLIELASGPAVLPEAEKKKPPSREQARVKGFANRIGNRQTQIFDYIKRGKDLRFRLPLGEDRNIKNAFDDILVAILRKESLANITENEFKVMRPLLIPNKFDTKSVVQSKLDLIEQYRQDMEAEARGELGESIDNIRIFDAYFKLNGEEMPEEEKEKIRGIKSQDEKLNIQLDLVNQLRERQNQEEGQELSPGQPQAKPQAKPVTEIITFNTIQEATQALERGEIIPGQEIQVGDNILKTPGGE